MNGMKGTIVGIDFGHAFGSATMHLGIPEVVPFRWTSQMEGLFSPLGSNVMIRPVMNQVLQVMHNEREFLLDTLQVFVKEPLFDWDRFQKREEYDDDERGSASSYEWYPKERLATVREKLELLSPCQIVMRDLEKRKDANNLKPLYNAVAKVSSSPAKQSDLVVEELLALASSRDILARAYVGWQPWL